MNASIDLVDRVCVWTIDMYISRAMTFSKNSSFSKRAKNWYTFVEDYLSNYKLIGIVLFDVLYRDTQKGVCINLCWIRFGVESNFFFNLITCENSHFSLLYR